MLERPREIIVRTSDEDDVPAMLAIYTHHIQRGLGEFDLEPLHPEDIKRRRKNMQVVGIERRRRYRKSKSSVKVHFAAPAARHLLIDIGGFKYRGRACEI